MAILVLLWNFVLFMQETADHLLYPNPASQMVSDEHLQYFEFFGKILGKVCCYIVVFHLLLKILWCEVCTGCLSEVSDQIILLDHIDDYYSIMGFDRVDID